MTDNSLSNCRPVEKDDVNGGIKSLDSLNRKLRSIVHIMRQNISNAKDMDKADFVRAMSDVSDKLWSVHVLAGSIEPAQIVIDFAEMFRFELPDLAE